MNTPSPDRVEVYLSGLELLHKLQRRDRRIALTVYGIGYLLQFGVLYLEWGDASRWQVYMPILGIAILTAGLLRTIRKV